MAWAEGDHWPPGYDLVSCAGTNQTKRGTLNFTSGVTCADDAANVRTNITLEGTISGNVPTLTLEDTTANHDDFEVYAEAGQLIIVNKTTGNELLWTDGVDRLVSDRTWDLSRARLRIPSGVTRPTPCGEGELFYDGSATSGQRLYACQSNRWVLQGDGGGGGGGSGTVTQVDTGTGLTGGPITTTGTISLVTPVAVANGGTGLASGVSGGVLGYTAAGILASSAALTANGLLLGGGDGATPTSLSAATNGQIPIGSTGSAPILASVTGVASETDVTNGAGSITIGLVDPLIVGKGGTGTVTFTTNGVLYGQAASAIAVTAQGPTNSVLTASAGAPSFSATPALTGVSVTNNVQWLPASGSQFEAYASGSQWFLTDLTTGNVILRVDNTDKIVSTQTIDLSGATLKGIVPNKEFVWPAASLLPLEFSSDAIPPVVKNAGTNVDILTVDYDDTLQECREATFQIPANVNTTGTVVFRIVWYAATQAANNVIWDIRYLMRANAQTWDAALTTRSFPPSTASASANVVTILTQQVPIGELGWTTGGNYVLCELCRNGANAGDTLVGDAKLIQLAIEIPRLR